MTEAAATEIGWVYSTLADDSDLADLVEAFVSETPLRIQSLRACWAERDLTGLARIAHQIKGAAGSYGFHQVTPVAARLESAASQRSDDVGAALEALVRLCQRLHPGSPASGAK